MSIMYLNIFLTILWTILSNVNGRGLLLLYRPQDISEDCVFSEKLRYDLSFGMGMSDTITLVFRSLDELDYECKVEIFTDYDESIDLYLIVVIRFPNSIRSNCIRNPDAFTVFSGDRIISLCDHVSEEDTNTRFFAISLRQSIEFRFVSNNSINSDMNAHVYEVTATSARLKGPRRCAPINETICMIGEIGYCFTSGVVCDGIKNCGVADWYDERKSMCDVPIQYLGWPPVIAITAALFCALLAATHILLQCLPPLAYSFFIFNTNEDNRLFVQSMFKAPGEVDDFMQYRNESVISVFSISSSDDSGDDGNEYQSTTRENKARITDNRLMTNAKTSEEKLPNRKRRNMKSMTSMIQNRLRSVAFGGKPDSTENNSTVV